MTGTMSWWAGPDLTAWIGALGGLAGFVALLLTVWRQRRLRVIPPGDLREHLLFLDECLGDIVAGGGVEAPWFLTPERRREETLLAALNGALVDEELNTLVGAARANYGGCWETAAVPGMRDAQKVTQHLAFARSGRTYVTKAIDRMNLLIRNAA